MINAKDMEEVNFFLFVYEWVNELNSLLGNSWALIYF